jgi:glycosyltransferase involved in cell wall biosynthesis
MTSDAPLTVAVVSTQKDWYGGEEAAYLLSQGLRRHGHRVHVLARRNGRFARRMNDEGFSVAEFAGNGQNPLALWQIRRCLRRLRPDVLHYNDPHAVTAAGLASVGLKIPVRVAVRHVAWPIRSPRRFLAFCDRIICVSHAVADVCRAGKFPPEMLRVVFLAGDPERVLAGDRRRGRLAAGVADDRTMILVVAGLNENKGHAFLLDAMPAVLQRHPDAHLILAGDGPQAEPLQHQTQRLGIESHVRFLGYRRDIPDLLHAADLVVLPSLAEGFGLAVVDAMFAGVPVVATATGGVADIAGTNDPKCEPVAWVVRPGDSKALAAAVIESLDSPEQRRLRTDLARQRAERLFTPDRMVDGTLAVYREVLTEKQ